MTALTVPLPPTADLPQYADYPVRYAVQSRSTPFAHTETFEDALAYIAKHRISLSGDVPVFAEHVAPDGMAVVTACWGGGTWVGKCGSTRWVQDLDGSLRTKARFMAALTDRGLWTWQPTTARDQIARGQAWYVRGSEQTADWYGFRVECQQKYRHDGTCRAEMWRWDSKAAVPLD